MHEKQTLFPSCRIIAAFEAILNAILQYVNFDELLVVERDVALRAERVSVPGHKHKHHD